MTIEIPGYVVIALVLIALGPPKNREKIWDWLSKLFRLE